MAGPEVASVPPTRTVAARVRAMHALQAPSDPARPGPTRGPARSASLSDSARQDLAPELLIGAIDRIRPDDR
ncbi:hypothetical protein GCM10027590_10430 [Nocardiopsis nanhaiensis]